MRALDLLGLPAPKGEPLHFRRRTRLPLILPRFVPAEDQESIIAFYQQVVKGPNAGPLSRTEIDWHQGLLRAGQLYLEDCLRPLGSSGFLLVVRVQQADVNITDILREPTIRRVEHITVSSAS